MLNPSIANEWAHTLTQLVADVENRIILEIARSVAAHKDAAWWDTHKLQQVATLHARLAEHLDQPWQDILTRAQYALDLAAQTGQDMAQADIHAYHATHTHHTVVSERTAAALAHISADTLTHLTHLPALVLRDALDAYHTITTPHITSFTLGVGTRREATRDALNRFAANGIDSFTDKTGRRWRIDSYAEMALRTGFHNALRAGYTHTLSKAGFDLVHVIGGGYTCSKCAPWEGRILSLTGLTPTGRHRFRSATGDRWETVSVDATYDQARAEGLFHPNCGHTIAAYIPGASRAVPTTDGDPDVYAASQKQRSLERAIRKEKRLLAASLTPNEAGEHRRKIRAYQARIRGLISKHPELTRKRWRETNVKPRPSYAPQYERDRMGRKRAKTGKPSRLVTAGQGAKVHASPDTGKRFSLLKPEQVERARRLETLRSDMSALKDSQGRWKPNQILEAHEIDFVERFERRGERVKWIARDESEEHKSTNDFEWLTRGGIASELKCASGNYPTLSKTIRRAVIRARDHGVTKDTFIIDRAQYKLTQKLEHQLSLYNQRHPDAMIRRLFVLCEAGSRLVEIILQ